MHLQSAEAADAFAVHMRTLTSDDSPAVTSAAAFVAAYIRVLQRHGTDARLSLSLLQTTELVAREDVLALCGDATDAYVLEKPRPLRPDCTESRCYAEKHTGLASSSSASPAHRRRARPTHASSQARRTCTAACSTARCPWTAASR